MKKSRKRIKKFHRKKAKKLIKKKNRKRRKKPRKKQARKLTRKRITRKKTVKKKPAEKKRVVRKRKVVKKRRPARKTKKRVVKRRVVKRKPARKKPIRKRRHKKIKIVRRSYSGGGPIEQLFESPIKVQVMKLFFRNPEDDFLFKEVRKRLRGNLSAIKREMKKLEKIGLLRTKQISPRKQLFSINSNFDFFNELKELILKASPVSKGKILKAIRRLGRIRLVLLSGLFMGNNMSRADLLIAGDNINSRKLNTFIKNLEAEVGGEVKCVAMTTEEFNYRYDMYDRFIRDLLNEKCEFLINRLGL